MRTYVTLPSGLSANDWRERHIRDEVPDSSPWGLHQLAEHGIDVRFSERSLGRFGDRVARAVRHRTNQMEIVETISDFHSLSKAKTDAVFAYHEWTGFPACLARMSRRSAPVMTGVAWLTTRDATSGRMAAVARTALPRAAAVFAQSAPIATVLHDEWGVPNERLHYVPVGIDTDFYAVQPPPEQPDLIVSLGEDPFRAHEFLISAAKLVRHRRPSARLELATTLDVDVPSELGRVHRERLYGRARALYQRSSVVAVALKPTITGSGLTVVLEGMASGRPVVVTHNPGISDYINDGVDGVLVPAGDEVAFADAVHDLLADPQRAQEIGRAAAARVRRNYPSARMARDFALILKSVT
jgi:glycosyltransferase involved in cell wall biosynthesis